MQSSSFIFLIFSRLLSPTSRHLPHMLSSPKPHFVMFTSILFPSWLLTYKGFHLFHSRFSFRAHYNLTLFLNAIDSRLVIASGVMFKDDCECVHFDEAVKSFYTLIIPTLLTPINILTKNITLIFIIFLIFPFIDAESLFNLD